ncbi:hypothetical protein LDENG_00231590 [Lucifuga dentata]|nr:hypothetical protein LDENG_00231590 [Lucifuga dentata]
MPRKAVADRADFGESFGLSSLGMSLSSGGAGGSSGNSSKPWPGLVLSVLGSAALMAAVGAFCALFYPVIKELRAERVRGEDGMESRMLGFWSILMSSVSVGFICCIFSWTLTYLDSYQPSLQFPLPQMLSRLRHVTRHGYHMGYCVAVLNGLMAMLTVIWSLT